MRVSAFIGLALVTGAALVSAVATSDFDRGADAPVLQGQSVYPGLKDALGTVQSIRLETPQATLTFQSDGTVWRIAERDGYPANMARLAETVFALSDLVYVEPKTRDADRYARLEVEDRSADDARSRRIVLTGPDNAVLVDLIAGRRKFDLSAGTATRGLYLRKTGTDQSWLASGSLGLSDSPSAWLQPDVLSITPDRVDSVTLTHRNGERVSVRRTEDGFAVPTLPPGAVRAPDRTIQNALSALDALQLEDVARLSDLTFAGGDETEAVYDLSDGMVISITVLTEATDADRPARWAMIDVDSGPAEARQAIADRVSGWVFKIPTWNADQMTLRNSDLIAPSS